MNFVFVSDKRGGEKKLCSKEKSFFFTNWVLLKSIYGNKRLIYDRY